MSKKRTGVMLVNLGTPDKPEKAAVRAYLREFLMDPRVINLPFILRFFLVYLIIVPKRVKRVTELYRNVWEEDSPIRTILNSQCRALESSLNESGYENIPVVAAMTYGYPSIPLALEKMANQGVENLIVLPLYPQFSRTTTIPVKERVEKALETGKSSLTFKFVDSYFQEAAYIEALKEQILERWHKLNQLPDVLLLSYHGIPVSYTEAGDPYIEQCNSTTARIREALRDFPVRIEQGFQSRVTKEEWHRPYTDELIISLAESGAKNIEVCCPGFSADCLETIDEIGNEYRELFLTKGGENFFVFPALNERKSHILMMQGIIEKLL